MRTPVKNFRISLQGILQAPKQLKSVLSRGVCDKATAQTAQFRQWESFRGLVDIQRCPFREWVLMWDVRFGRYKPTKRTNFGDRRTKALRERCACCHLASDVEPWSLTVQRQSNIRLLSCSSTTIVKLRCVRIVRFSTAMNWKRSVRPSWQAVDGCITGSSGVTQWCLASWTACCLLSCPTTVCCLSTLDCSAQTLTNVLGRRPDLTDRNFKRVIFILLWNIDFSCYVVSSLWLCDCSYIQSSDSVGL